VLNRSGPATSRTSTQKLPLDRLNHDTADCPDD
jgi:hypothetical protein